MTECHEALVVRLASTTARAERGRLRAELSKSRGAFGRYAETSQPGAPAMAERLGTLAGQPDNATLIPEPHSFGATPAAELLPRGARIVGWLEQDGYRSVAGMPQPAAEWLHEASTRLAPVAAHAGWAVRVTP